MVPSIRFQTFFVQELKIVVDSWQFSMLLLYILWDDWPIFKFKSTATPGIGINPTKAWLSLLVNFKNSIGTWGHFTRTICNKILFLERMPQKRKECFSLLLKHLAWIEHQFFEWHKRFKEGREAVRDDESCERSKEVYTLELIDQRLRVRLTMLRF